MARGLKTRIENIATEIANKVVRREQMLRQQQFQQSLVSTAKVVTMETEFYQVEKPNGEVIKVFKTQQSYSAVGNKVVILGDTLAVG